MTPGDKLLLSPDDVCRVLSVGKTTLYGLIATQQFPIRPVRFGRKTLYPMHEVERWVQEGCPASAQWEKGGRKQ